MLQNYSVLNLASVGPGARATQILADFGATVIQIVPLSDGVQITPAFYAYGAGRGTRKIALDLKTDRGREILLSLARQANVLIESFRPGVVQRLSIDYNRLREVNPQMVYCSTSGYGQDGPYAQRAGHDINYLAMSGYLDCCGRDAEGNPALPGATIADSAGGGMHAGLSIMAALLSGEGRYLDVSVCEGVLSLMSLNIDKYLATGEANTAGSDLLTGRYAWYGIYRCQDGKFVALGAIEQKFYANLCRLLSLDAFAQRQYDESAQPELRRVLQELFLSRDRDDWVALLADADTCVSPVLSVSEVTENKHLRQRNNFQPLLHPQHDGVEQLGRVLAGTERNAVTRIGEGSSDAADILYEHGFSAQEVAELVENRCVQ